MAAIGKRSRFISADIISGHGKACKTRRGCPNLASCLSLYRRGAGHHPSDLYLRHVLSPRTAKDSHFWRTCQFLKQAGFSAQSLPDGRIKVAKHGIGAIIGDEGKNQPDIEEAGVLVRGEIATLLSGGYQMFLETPGGRRLPATAPQLRALHTFEEDVKDALGLDSLYNTSLGTTSRRHMYDRLQGRDQGVRNRPWDHPGIIRE